VEVSLDISFDVMITQVAPVDGLVQRMGRVNRRRERQSGLADVHVLGVPTQCLPYKKELLQTTLNALPDNGCPLEATCLQSIIDQVYPVFNPTAIEANLAWSADGTYTKRALCNGSTNLMQLLEIDTVSAILMQDFGEYQEANNFMARRMLEIPVPPSVRFRNLPRRIVGTDEIYLVDQSPDDYEHYGLRLNNTIDTQDSNII
jgi:CRISPR-associated endonuclease/helicase Cas3